MRYDLSDQEARFIERYRDLLPEFQKMAGKQLDNLFELQTDIVKMAILGVDK